MASNQGRLSRYNASKRQKPFDRRLNADALRHWLTLINTQTRSFGKPAFLSLPHFAAEWPINTLLFLNNFEDSHASKTATHLTLTLYDSTDSRGF